MDLEVWAKFKEVFLGDLVVFKFFWRVFKNVLKDTDFYFRKRYVYKYFLCNFREYYFFEG